MAVRSSITNMLMRPRKRRWYSYLDLIIIAILLISIFIFAATTASPASGPTPSSTSQAQGHAVKHALMIPTMGNPGGGAPTIDTPQWCKDHPQDCADNNQCVLSPQQCSPFSGPTSLGANPQDTFLTLNPLDRFGQLIYFTDPVLTYNNDQVQKMWAVMLAAVDIFVVLMIALNGLRIMFTGMVFKFADAVESLPNILLALIAAHLSFLMLTAVIQLNNTATVGFFNWATHNTTPTQSYIVVNDGCVGPGLFGWCPFGHRNDPADIAPPNIGDGNLDLSSGSFISPSEAFQSMADLVKFGIQIVGLMIFVQLVIRLFFINLFLIFSPLGIASWALPGRAGQSLTVLTLKGAFTTIGVQFLQGGALLICQILIGQLMRYIQTSMPTLMSDATVVQLCYLTMNWFVFRIPSLFNTAPMRTMVEGGQAVGQVFNSAKQMSIQNTQQLIGMGVSVAGMAAMAFI